MNTVEFLRDIGAKVFYEGETMDAVEAYDQCLEWFTSEPAVDACVFNLDLGEDHPNRFKYSLKIKRDDSILFEPWQEY